MDPIISTKLLMLSGCLAIAAMMFGAWANPLPYVWRAFDVNAFVFAGGLKQKSAAFMGGVSALAIIVAWSYIFYQIVTGDVGVFS